MKTSLKSLEMKGLRSFVDPTSIVFPENGLLLLMGPSGSGKSTVFLGIAYGMGNCPYPASELQSWNGDQKLEVKLTLSTDDGDTTIVRGPKSYVEGAVNVQGASNIDPTIAKLTGLDQELLAALTYRPQKTPGLFLSKTNGGMQEFLSILLGLNKFDKAIEQCDDEIKKLESAVELQKAGCTFAEGEYKKAQALEEPGLHDPKDFKAQVASANVLCGKLQLALQLETEKINDFKAAWNKKLAAFTAEKQKARTNVPVSPSSGRTNSEIEAARDLLHNADARLKRMVENERKRRAEIAAKIDGKNLRLRTLNATLSHFPNYKTEIGKLEAELMMMKNAVCPKCSQPWMNADPTQTENRIEELRQTLDSEGSLHEEYKVVQKELDDLHASLQDDPRIAQMQAIKDDAAQKLQEEKDKLAKLVAEEKLAEQRALHDAIAGVMEREKVATTVYLNELAALQAVKESVQEEYNAAENAYNEARIRLTTIETENRMALKEQERIRKTKEQTKSDFEASSRHLAKYEKDLAEELDLREMIKSFLTAIFDEVLDQIAYCANDMMAQVPNISHITIKFKSERITQKGTVKRGIVPVVNVGGGERPLRSALSGGMASAVELAVDLAVRKVISARSGAIPGWLILDECFEGLGVADKEAALGLLKQAAEDTLILVIDHSSETKELFSKTITVENVNGRSQIAES